MLRTDLCDRLGIDIPVLQGPMALAATAPLAAAVSNAGGLGSLAGVLLSGPHLREQIERTRALTDRPFAVNHVLNQLDPDALQVTFAARPHVISFALGDPGDLVDRAHDAGSIVMHQAVTVEGATRAAERGVDVIIAQGGEAGGNSGLIGTLVLVPQVVDAVHPIPVVAAGGIGDGRGLAAALVLGAQGVNIGTRFLASQEATIPEGWKQAIVGASSQDVVKFEPWNRAFPPAAGDSFTVPSVIRTPFVEEQLDRLAQAGIDSAALRTQVLEAARAGRIHELVPLAGQAAGMIHQTLPVAEIMTRIVAEAEAVLETASRLQARDR